MHSNTSQLIILLWYIGILFYQQHVSALVISHLHVDYFSFIFFLLALQPPLGVIFYSPLVGFSLLACEVS